MKNNIKAIIFDVGGVVTKPGTTTALIKFYSKKFKIPLSTVDRFVRKQSHLAEINKISFDDFIDLTAEHFGLEDKKEILRKATLNLNRPRKETLNLIENLRKNYKIYALSNHIKTWFEYEKKRYSLKRYFDRIFTSYEIGASKPRPKIFKFVLNKLKLKPHECIFIDNSIKNEAEAKKLHFKIVLFRSVSEVKRHLTKYGVKL
jgi:HAD superfamily hydrolase (TIGR01509 family)